HNGTYDIVERVMCPLALRQTQRPRSDHGKVHRLRHSVSSSSSHHQGTSSHQHDDDDDDDDVKTSRASTPSPTTYLNSLHPLDYYKTTKYLPLLNNPMNLSLHDKPSCSTKHNECMRRCVKGSNHLERH
ncbi:hypothetical protein Tco_0380576, partial [Tanacetum coccineum]